MDTELLIKEVFSRTALWDQNHSQHHNRVVLDVLWDEICVVMGVTREAAKVRWKSLRDSYLRELKKHSLPNTTGEVMSKWSFFKSLVFLKNQFYAKRSKYHRLSSVPLEETKNSEDVSFIILSDANTLNQTIPPTQSWLCIMPPNQQGTNSNTDITATKRKRCTEEVQDERDAQGKRCTEEDEKLVKKNSSEDDDDLQFFMSLLPTIQSLPPNRKFLLRIKIQELVYKEIYSSQSDCHHSNVEQLMDEDSKFSV